MVRTRHSGGDDDVESSDFMSLHNERGRFTMQKKDRSANISHQRQAYQEDDDEYNIFEHKVVESRLRPRSGPRQAHNYLDADSSDDDHGRRRNRHSSPLEIGHYRTRRIKKEMLEDFDEDERPISSRIQTNANVNDKNYPLRRRSLRQTGRQQSMEGEGYTRRTKRNEQLDKKDEEEADSENEGQKDRETEDDEQKDDDSDNEDQNEEFTDMYSRVKRKRIRMKRGLYDEVEQNRNNNQEDSDEEEDVVHRSERNLRKKAPQIIKSYSLREHKPRTDLYKAPVEERKIRKNAHSIFEVTPTKKTSGQPYQSPAQRRKIRKRSAMNSSSSSTSSSSSESSDEKSFKKRKGKSMAKARSRMMPMNFSNSDPASVVIKDRVKSGASLADVEPMNIDKSITFDSIGGLGKHIRALKEMVVFPLLYDKVFQKFNVDPPRGVLFYGPPGTGKTLVARALANECSHGEKRVAFFMRKGADCLSKWVGESERQLRLLFDQAYKYRPSIIFFDEIDGLAPVRSSRQDQIHSSIVSTLLALMDGLDSRGEIVVIGATNRIDSLDPALRRPGRFDREFLFPLPTLEARKQILKIQTASWNPRLNDDFVTELAEKCVGYCGADIKALCTEAAMLALRRRYPQIYLSKEALQLDESSISVCAKDFFNAVSNIIPTSRRSVNSPGRPLSLHILPLLGRQLNNAINQLSESFPPCLMKMSSLDAVATSSQAQALADSGMSLEELASDEDEDAPSIFVSPTNKGYKSQSKKSLEAPSTSKTSSSYLNFTSFSTHQPTTFRPRMMLTGKHGQGQTAYLAPAIIHRMEDLPVHVLDLPALYAVTAKTPEESCANVFHEARRKCPCIVYMPYINQWWDVLGDTVRTTLLTLIQDLDPSTPLLLLATSEQPYSYLDPQLQALFNEISGEVLNISNPTDDERKNFFKDLLLQHSHKAPPQKKAAAKRMLEILPKAAPVTPRELTKQEMDTLLEKEELTLMELRIFLRDVLHKLGSDKKFSIFTKPVDIENAPDYYDVIENPMDMSTIMSKIDCHEYNTVRSFMDDIDLICSNALEYNPDRGPMDKVIRHRACAFKDTAYAIIKTELDKEFEKLCVDIEQSRKRRGVKSTTVPTFYRTKPIPQKDQSSSRNVIPSYLDNNRPPRSIPKPEGERYSRRVRGIHIDPAPTLEDVERVARTSHSNGSPSKEEPSQPSNTPYNNVSTAQGPHPGDSTSKHNSADESMESESLKVPVSQSQTDPLHKKKSRQSKCVWCKPSRRRRKLFQSQRIPAMVKRQVIQNARSQFTSNVGGSQSSSVHQILNIDTSVSNESEELKSPVRKSSRISSPPILIGGVTTRRQSLSPRVREAVDIKSKDLPDLDNPTKEFASSSKHDESSQAADRSMFEDHVNTDDKIQPAEIPKFLENTIEILKTAETTKDVRKPSVVKSLDMDLVAADSGAGSSLDGNGDSRDSMDHKLEEANPTTSSHQGKDINQNNRQDSTYSNEISNKLVIPTNKLSNLLERLVCATKGFNVEQLEKIYSQLSQIIYKHRHSYNRFDMVNELEKKVVEMTRQHPGV